MANVLYGRCDANRPLTIQHGNMTMVFAPAQFWPTYWLAINRVDFSYKLKSQLRIRLKRDDAGKILRYLDQVTGRQIKMNWSDYQYKLVLFDRIKVEKIKVYYIHNTNMRSVLLSDSYLSVNCRSASSIGLYDNTGLKAQRLKLALALSQILMLRRSDKIRHDDVYWSESRFVRGLIITGAVITVFAEGIYALIKLVVIIVVGAYNAFNAVLKRFTELVLTGDFPALQRDLQKLVGGVLHGVGTVVSNIKKGYDIVTTIWGDEKSRALLFAFMKEYVDGTSVVDSATFKLSLTIDVLIIVGTLGAGAVVVGARLAQRVGQFTVRALKFIVDLYRAIKLSRAIRKVDVKKLDIKAPKQPIVRQIEPPKKKPDKPDKDEPNNTEDNKDNKAASTPRVASAPIDYDGHIFSAEVKPNGNVVGGHSTATGEVKVIPGTASTPNAQGVYSAKIEVPDPNNPGQFLPKTNNNGVSTMFPDSWNVDKVKLEVDTAYQNRVINGNKWSGTTPSGVKVEGYISPKTTVYPKL